MPSSHPHDTNHSPPQDKIVGILVRNNGQLKLKPCNKKKARDLYDLKAGALNGAVEGDVVVVVPQSGGGQLVVKRVLGKKDSPGILSLISLYEQGLSEEFSQAAKNELNTLPAVDLQGREDLRNIPLVTIDGADSRDFDDAVFAEKTADGGFHLIVAIADVAWYVRPGSGLDKDAYARGNSTYFPDRVVPMLPEHLSNGLCSLKPNEDRACLAFHLWIDKDGNLTKQEVVRGLMRSAARLTYEQVQKAKDGQPDNVTGPLMNSVVSPLYAAYDVLRKARGVRGAMDMNIPESKVAINDNGGVADVKKAVRYESCRVIEEFMVLANVAAAKALESKQAPCVYRVHDCPSAELVEDLRKYVGSFGLTLPAGEIKSADAFKDVLEKAAGMPEGQLITSAIMRIQAKAIYDTLNIGHFGLALKEYAHFTSPIRRYADLLVHRSLIDAFNLGAGALDVTQKAQITDMAKHISATERLSDKVVRAAHDRFAAAFLSANIGQTFTGRITTVTKSGLFVRLDKAGTEGLLVMRNLPNDFYELDKDKHMLKGRDHGREYVAGAEITVRVKEADGLTGNVILAAANDNSANVPGKQFVKKAQKPNNGNKGPSR
jgi:ribonuclease R